MEDFKKNDEINLPDERNLLFGSINTETGKFDRLTLERIYRAVELVELSERAPESVRSQFNVAKNLAVYTWYSYSFNQISELKAYSCVEMALKDRLGKHKYGFRGLIKKAVTLGLIQDKGFEVVREPSDSNEYSEGLIDIIPNLRNELAHGSTTLHPGAVFTLQWCSDFINQLYENDFDKSSL